MGRFLYFDQENC